MRGELPSEQVSSAPLPPPLLVRGPQASAAAKPRPGNRQVALSFIGSFIGIGLLAQLTAMGGYPLIAAPLGATSVLVFGLPDSPLAQPRNVLCGNLTGAIVSVLLVACFGSAPWVMALAVALTIAITQITGTVHPPAGAVALVGVMGQAQWPFIFEPVLAGSLILVLWTTLLGRLAPERAYPKRWF